VPITGKTMYARFGNAALAVATEATAASAFSYQAPTVTGSSVTMSASTGVYGYYAAFGVAHKASIVPPATAIALTVPEVPTLGVPLDGATLVDGTTDFSWSGPPGHVYVFLLAPSPSSSATEQYAVVTTGTSIHLPDFSIGGLSIPTGYDGNWSVEAHGPATNMDAITEDGTFLDPFAYGQLAGRDRDGTYLWSAHRVLTTK
jgi:hypothetical protein